MVDYETDGEFLYGTRKTLYYLLNQGVTVNNIQIQFFVTMMSPLQTHNKSVYWYDQADGSGMCIIMEQPLWSIRTWWWDLWCGDTCSSAESPGDQVRKYFRNTENISTSLVSVEHLEQWSRQIFSLILHNGSGMRSCKTDVVLTSSWQWIITSWSWSHEGGVEYIN